MYSASTQIASLPGSRPRVRGAVWALAAAIVVAGVLGALSLARFGPQRTDPASAAYQRDARAVLATHNALAASWNDFVPRYNATPETNSDAVDAVNREGLAITSKLVRDSQSLITRWRRLSPPDAHRRSHSLAMSALETTQDGYLTMDDYFRAAANQGFADASLAQSGSEQLDAAAALWEEARAAGAQ